MSKKKKEPSLTDRMEIAIRATLDAFDATECGEEEFTRSALSALDLVRFGLQMRLDEIEEEIEQAASQGQENDP